MGVYEELPVYKASYDLLLHMFSFIQHFKKEFKYTVGERMKHEAMQLVKYIYLANSAHNKTETIARARECIGMVRLHLRLMKDMKQISIRQFVFLNEKIEVVSRQLTGWQRSQLRNHPATPVRKPESGEGREEIDAERIDTTLEKGGKRPSHKPEVSTKDEEEGLPSSGQAIKPESPPQDEEKPPRQHGDEKPPRNPEVPPQEEGEEED